MMVQIDIQHVSKTFHKTIRALQDVSVSFQTGNLYGIIGPAGAGKTTLLRIMLGLLKADEGKIICKDGDRIIENIQENIAYMPQSQSLYADLSVEEHLQFFRDLYGIDKKTYSERKENLLQMTRLKPFESRPAGALSGGMYKKLGLMCALLRSPKIMLLDEPTNGVDPISRREFWNLLHQSVENGILVLMTTAYMDEAERCSEAVLMENGHLLGHGEPAELLEREQVKNFDEYFLKRGGELK